MTDERLDAVRGYAAAVVGCDPDRITAVRRFDDGNRHDVYRVSSVDADDLVVRVSFSDDPVERAQAEREARVLEAVGGRAAPRLLDFRPTSPWFAAPVMSMTFVDGEQLDLRHAPPTDVARLGEVVAWVHARSATWLDDAGDIASYAADRLRSILDGRAWLREPLDASLRSRLDVAADAIEQRWDVWRSADCVRAGGELALLHGDIAPGNVLWSPAPVLIDWEYARLGDPADEIAYLFDQHQLDADRRTAFWRGYGTDQAVVDRVDWWEPTTLLGSALWWVERWVRRTEADAAGTVDPDVAREPPYYLERVMARLERLERLSR